MKNKKIIIISIVAIVVLIVVTLVTAYFTTDFLKSNKQLFYKYIAKTELINSNIIQNINSINNKMNQNNSSSYTQLNFSTSVPNIETGIDDVQNLFAIKGNGLESVTTKQSYKDYTLSINEQNLLTLKYLKDNNTYAIGADNILAKYIAVENSNLKELFQKIGVEDVSFIPDSIRSDYKEILKIDDKTLAALKETYFNIIYDGIPSDNYFKTTNSDGTQTYGVSLSEQNTMNILKQLLETAKNDNVLLNLIVTKLQLIGYNDLSVQNLQEGIQDYLNKITEYTYSTSQDFINLSLIKKDKKIIGINFESNQTEETIQYTPNTESENFDDVIETPVIQNSRYNIRIDLSEANKLVLYLQENDTETIVVTIDYFYGDNALNLNMQIDFKDTGANSLNTNSIIKIQYQLSGYQTETITKECVLNLGNDDRNYQVNYLNNTTLKQDVQIEKLTENNSAKLNDMTAEQIQQFLGAVTSRVYSLYGDYLGEEVSSQ